MPPHVGAQLRQQLRTAEVLIDWLPRRSLLLGQPRMIANGLPKAGTNLLIKALTSSAGLHRSRVALHGQTQTRHRPGPTLALGVDAPREVAVSVVRDRLRWVAPGTVVSAHLPDSANARTLLATLGYRMAVIVRDPRDVAVSFVRYVSRLRGHPLHERFAAASAGQRLLWTIEGIPGELDDLGARVRRVSAWRSWHGARVVRFEDLIGPAGGGDTHTQTSTLMVLAKHGGARTSAEQAAAAGRGLFGGTRTFRRGQRGGWHEHFEPVHTRRIKDVAGEVLIELGYETHGDWEVASKVP